MSQRRSMISARTPDLPAASVLARSTSIALTTSSGRGGPTPTAWLRTRFRWSDLGDDLRRLFDLTLRGSVESDRDVPARNGDHVCDGEIVARESEGGYFRFSRYQAPSSV